MNKINVSGKYLIIEYICKKRFNYLQACNQTFNLLLFLTHFPIGGGYLHEEQKCAKYFTLLDTFLNGKT